ncbi:restriction endonuclease subunit S [Maribacter sp. MMG018]|uniref:restriction endonuclease subunit S n=1 Tax=Maribacter sp. MMG018 TaxID=2822688 RepID=UPI001B37CBDB|nr:restriction endonuclease subunit S [Maribacter sp. MMG018]MBQ4915274.1 restriction endonuclease subunit S [Maribacter sp. MMG018]
MQMKIDKSNWKKVKIIDVFTKKEENDKDNAKNRFDRFLKVNHMDAETLHIKRWGSQENGEELNPTFYKIFRKGQILFPTRNPHLRRAVLASFDGICGEKTLTLEPNEEFLIPEFIPFLFHSDSFYAHTTGAIIGSTNPHCRWRDVANYEFLLPPKEQQAQLAELLWAMDEVVEKNTELLEKSEIMERLSLADLFDKKKVLSNIPLGNLYKKKFKSIDPTTLFDKDVEHFSLPSFMENQAPEKVKASSIKSNKLLISDDAVLFSKLNPNRPKIWAVRNLGNEYKLGSTEWLPVRPNNDFSINYILAFLSSQTFIQRVMRYVQGTSNSHKRIDPKRFYLLKIPLFSKEDSEDIINCLLSFQKSKVKTLQTINSSKALQKSLINQVF